MRLGMMAVYVLLPAGLWAQTTYSSPVRVTNTPLPVNGDVKVTGNVPVVNPTGVPMQVKAWDTIPVAQQGAVTVTPNGGAMVVAPQGGSFNVVPAGGAMPVSLSGTPSVGLSPGANEVKLAIPTLFERRDDNLWVLEYGEASDQVPFGLNLPSGAVVELESIMGSCRDALGSELVVSLYAVPAGATEAALYPLTSVRQGRNFDGSLAIHRFVHPLKIAAKPNTRLELRVLRYPAATENVVCSVVVTGRVY